MRGDGFFVSSKKRGKDRELSGKCSLVHPFTSDVIVVMLEDKVVDAFFLTIENVCKQTVATTKNLLRILRITDLKGLMEHKFWKRCYAIQPKLIKIAVWPIVNTSQIKKKSQSYSTYLTIATDCLERC